MTLGQMQEAAAKRQAEFEARVAREGATSAAGQGAERELKPNKTRHEADMSRRAFYRDFKGVAERSDVLLEVLDARDPMGCQARSVEEWITSTWHDKRIVIVLNKIGMCACVGEREERSVGWM